ncbi:hypothetical protein V500_02949 [Pseudogymnoascus sp. VKM F-4518 (FW-2643)]|nr:hypothetical protein V500_02949 [Pseudogymnoascus sp. VKM F-4518 (FW-2643)]
MPRTGRTRALPIQETEDSSCITVSAPPSKRPRGRPRKNPLQSKKPRTAPSYKSSDPAIVSTSKPIITTPSGNSKRASRSAAPASHTASDSGIHKLGKKRKRTLSEDACPTDLQTVCEGCRQRSYHSENLDETPVIICYKCEKGWHALCMAREGTNLDVPGQWECFNCSGKGKAPPSQPANTDDTQADVMMLNRQAEDAANKIAPSVLGLSSNIVTKELYMPRMKDYHGDHLNVSKIAVIQAQNDLKKDRRRLSNVLSEQVTCRERLYTFKGEIEWLRRELEEHRKHFHSDVDAPSEGEPKLSMAQQVVLGISGDGDWTDKVSAKVDLIKADEALLTERVKSLQESVKIKKAKLKVVEQQHSAYSTCLETSCRALDKLQSIITIDFEDSSPRDSDCSSVSTVEDSVADSATNTGGDEITHSDNADISPNRIANGIERLPEEANQQLDGTDALELSQLAEDTDRLPQSPSRPPLMIPLQTNAQEQPAVCTTSEATQLLQNSSSAEDRDRMRGLFQLPETDKQREHLISAEDIKPPQTQAPKRSLIVFFRYTPAKVLARASHTPGIGPKRLENVDESECQGSSRASEIDQEPEVSEPSNATKAIQEPSVLQQTLELVKRFRMSNTEKRSLQEASTQPSNSSLHVSSGSGLVEARNQRRAVSLATSVAQGSDHSCPPEGCCQSFNPAGVRTSAEDFDLPKPPEPSISLVQEAALSIPTGVQLPEEPHIPRLALEGLARSPANLMHNEIVLPPITNFSPTHNTLQPSALPSLAPQTHTVHNKIVLPPTTDFSPKHNTLQSSALPSLAPQTPQTHILQTSMSSNSMGHHTMNSHLQTRLWSPSLNFRERITDLLLNGEDDTVLSTPTMIIYHRDLRTLVPDVGYLSEKIINEYLKFLAQYTNARRESDLPGSCNKIAMIGSTDPIPDGLLKRLDTFSAIYVPIKVETHWILAVLYPGPLGQRGRAEVYDSHQHWTRNIMTTSNVFEFLKSRLGDEYKSGDWTASAQQCSRPQRSEADSGLYVLANAKSKALNLQMMGLNSPAQSISLRWQFAQELVMQSVVEAF